MDLNLDVSLKGGYRSLAQQARVLTEAWLGINAFCPNCDNESLNLYTNNNPAGDFYCPGCQEDFELKSKQGGLSNKLVNGAYESLIRRITSAKNPNLFYLTYDTTAYIVTNLQIIPKYFFTPHIVERRSPLRPNARRAGWIGCNIDLSFIPQLGRIFLVRSSQPISPLVVREEWKRSRFIRNESESQKGWLFDLLLCIEGIPKKEFSLSDVYSFISELKRKHPNNKFLKEKIRQQLQALRDRGIIQFTSRGNYSKINYAA